MADENRIGFDIVVDTRASSENVTTLKQDINNLQAAIERASKTGLKINIDGADKSIKEAQQIQGDFITKLEKLNSASFTKLRENLDIQKKGWAEYDKTVQSAIDKQTQLADSMYKSRGTDYFSSEKQRINSNLQNAYYDLMVKDNNKAGYAKIFADSKKEAQELTRQVNQMGKAFENTGGNVVNFGNKLRSHLYWIAAGGMLGAITAVPYEVFNQLKQMETGMAGVNQVLDHNKISNDAAALGINEHTYAQQQLNSEQQKFIQIASAYGESVNDIIKAGKRKIAA